MGTISQSKSQYLHGCHLLLCMTYNASKSYTVAFIEKNVCLKLHLFLSLIDF